MKRRQGKQKNGSQKAYVRPNKCRNQRRSFKIRGKCSESHLVLHIKLSIPTPFESEQSRVSPLTNLLTSYVGMDILPVDDSADNAACRCPANIFRSLEYKPLEERTTYSSPSPIKPHNIIFCRDEIRTRKRITIGAAARMRSDPIDMT